MMIELCAAVLRANLLGAAAILAVLAVRRPARRLFGPEVAYWLWGVPLLVFAGALLPAGNVAPDAPAHVAVFGRLAGPAEPAPWLAAWACGVVGSGALAWRAQARFLRLSRGGRAGPAVVGVIAPRVGMPADDGRYTPEERALVRAHEREHIARRDPQARAWIAILQCLAWFNPLAHVAANAARLDQELACDAAVIRHRPQARGAYARALMKTQMSATPLPFGCYWPSASRHPLEVRVALLKRRPRPFEMAGAILVGAAAVSAGCAAWATQPPIRPRALYPIESWAADAQRETHVSMLLIRVPRGETFGGSGG